MLDDIFTGLSVYDGFAGFEIGFLFVLFLLVSRVWSSTAGSTAVLGGTGPTVTLGRHFPTLLVTTPAWFHAVSHRVSPAVISPTDGQFPTLDARSEVAKIVQASDGRRSLLKARRRLSFTGSETSLVGAGVKSPH